MSRQPRRSVLFLSIIVSVIFASSIFAEEEETWHLPEPAATARHAVSRGHYHAGFAQQASHSVAKPVSSMSKQKVIAKAKPKPKPEVNASASDVVTPPIQKDDLFNGFHLGFQGGATQATFQSVHLRNVFRFVPNNMWKGDLETINGGEMSSPFFTGAFFAGYGHSLGSFYLSVDGYLVSGKSMVNGQINFYAPCCNATASAGGVRIFENYHLQVKSSYGAAVRPGILLTPRTLFYGSIGVVGSHYNFDLDEDHSWFDPAEMTQSANQQGYLHGMQYGFGISSMIEPDISLGLEFLYTNFNSPSKLHVGNVDNKVGFAVYRHYLVFLTGNLKQTRYVANLTFFYNRKHEFGPDVRVGDFSGWLFEADAVAMRARLGEQAQRSSALDGFPATGYGQFDIIDDDLVRYLGEPGARIGYGGQWGKAYVGVNVHGEFFKARQYSSTNFVNSGQVPNRYELKYLTQSGRMGLQYGFQLTPGYLLAPHVLFYGVIGVNRTKLQVDQDAYLHLNGGVNFVNLHESLSKNVYGFDLGFGLAVKVKHHFGIRLQYDTVRYGSGYVEKAGYAPDDSITSVTAYTIYYTKMRPKTEAISLGLTYYLES